MRFLCVSDIHGHARSLEKVLTYGEKRRFGRLLAAGDHLFGGPEPLETWKLLVGQQATCTQGVGDRAFATLQVDKLTGLGAAEQAKLAALAQCRKELGELIVARLGRMPVSERIPLENGGELVLMHGSPADQFTALSHDLDEAELNALLADDPADLVVCGQSHVAFTRIVGDTQVINVGSVGESADESFAHGALIEIRGMELSVEPFAVKL